ncbi:MAG: hypothetical protein RB191_02230 [Terriglobia bacterium]|nr:hypothetical protein [Terriglobia bacterium]
MSSAARKKSGAKKRLALKDSLRKAEARYRNSMNKLIAVQQRHYENTQALRRAQQAYDGPRAA